MRSIVLLLLSCLLLGGPARSQVTKKTSSVTDTKRYVSADMRTLVSEDYPGHATFRAEYEWSDEAPPAWRISFYGLADATTDMSATTRVKLQVDGEPMTPIRVESKTREIGRGSIMEVKHATFSRADYKEIATAESVAAIIGPYEFGLTYPLRKDLRIIVDHMESPSDQPTAATDEES